MIDLTDKVAPVLVPPTRKAVFIANDSYRRHSYGRNHPLAIPRVPLTYDLICALGGMSDSEFRQSRLATDDELQWFHTSEYVDALRRCEQLGYVPEEIRRKHQLGNVENPFFPGMFTTPATATGGSIQAAEEMLAGNVAFNSPGGMHHALPNQARGFCFFNDPALAIIRLRHEGLRVLYVDIDAHHGDGVESAFANDPEVVCFSLHMATGYAYPFHGGGWRDWGALGNAVNVPLPKATNDTEYRLVFSALLPLVLAKARADAIVLQAGSDLLFADPLGKFNVSTGFMLELVEKILKSAPGYEAGQSKLVVLGGGGYHPLMVARAWAGVWGVISGRNLPVELPIAAQNLLHRVAWDQDEDEDYFASLFERRIDPPREGEVRDDVKRLLDNLLTQHPLWGNK